MSIFLEKDVVHPTVQFVKDEYQITWKELGDILVGKMSSLGYEINLSPANVRNFATSRSSAWWFWGCISDIVVGMWRLKRQEAKSYAERKNIDLEFSELFSDNLQAAYAFLYAVQEEDEPNSKIAAPAKVMSNSIVNEHEEFFSISFPTLD